ncbi:hypothetical protein KQI38_06105 [Tissierella carlieri]|nr:hypothetical protein [Tissierella carlieri]MBU5311595.1 hypothetical protein [Tissierella carlieri]
MKYTFLGKSHSIAYIESEDILIDDVQSALNLMMTVKYEKTATKLF